MQTIMRMLLLGIALALPACSTPPETRADSSAGGSSQSVRAECLVCKSEGDLACVGVKVHSDTPRTEYMGRTYYFCSEQCRKQFEKDPHRYLEQ